MHVVFHCGASLNMDSRLDDAVRTNVRGTADVLDIIKEADNLQAFVLVSTAYSNCQQSRIEERFYEPPVDPQLLIAITEGLKSDVLNAISTR